MSLETFATTFILWEAQTENLVLYVCLFVWFFCFLFFSQCNYYFSFEKKKSLHALPF